jgi:hypothetical protein
MSPSNRPWIVNMDKVFVQFIQLSFQFSNTQSKILTRKLGNKPREYSGTMAQKHLRWTIDGSVSSYSLFVTHIWLNDARTDPPTQAEIFLFPAASTLTVAERSKSLSILSATVKH